MLVIPAIDIIDGQCVRLTKGDFASKKIYANDPVAMAQLFESQGAPMVHIIDLDGAKTGIPKNQELIIKMRNALKIPVQVGGGIRTLEAAQTYLMQGIDRIILGTKALADFDFLRQLVTEFGAKRIVVALDIIDEKLAREGWLETGGQDLNTFAQEIKRRGITEVLVTDISRDGTLTTPNFELIEKVQSFGFNVVAAGGVSDTESLKKLFRRGTYGAVLGKALYENKISLSEAFNVTRPRSNLAKRIIPCLDVAQGRVVKGVNFLNIKDAGDPVELAKKYSEEGADELVFLDIMASKENRETMIDTVRRVAAHISIPFTVGGGVKTLEDIRALLNAGADKVSLNTAAIIQPELITEASKEFGAQCVVIAIDVKKDRDSKDDRYDVYIKGGSKKTELEAVSWAKRVEELGAGELLLTSMDRDGTHTGFDIELLQKITSAVRIPVIASGGAGSLEDLAQALTKGNADAVLAASLFHYHETTTAAAKQYLASLNIPVRI